MCDRRPKHQAAPWWTCHDLTSLRQRVELFGSEALQLETLLLDGADWWPPSQEGVSRPKAFRSPGGLRTGLPNCWIDLVQHAYFTDWETEAWRRKMSHISSSVTEWVYKPKVSPSLEIIIKPQILMTR